MQPVGMRSGADEASALRASHSRSRDEGGRHQRPPSFDAGSGPNLTSVATKGWKRWGRLLSDPLVFEAMEVAAVRSNDEWFIGRRR